MPGVPLPSLSRRRSTPGRRGRCRPRRSPGHLIAATIDVMAIDRAGPVPLYRQVAAVLLERIRSGEYKPGTVIPPESEMVLEFGVSRGTVRKALAVLQYDDRVAP